MTAFLKGSNFYMPRPYDTDEENKFGSSLLFSFVVYYVVANS
jgi:hypothetical protein